MPKVVLEDLAPRLERARDDVEATREAYEQALRQRNELVVQAVDEGMAQKRVATHAGVKPPHVIRILAASEPDAVLPRM